MITKTLKGLLENFKGLLLLDRDKHPLISKLTDPASKFENFSKDDLEDFIKLGIRSDSISMFFVFFFLGTMLVGLFLSIFLDEFAAFILAGIISALASTIITSLYFNYQKANRLPISKTSFTELQNKYLKQNILRHSFPFLIAKLTDPASKFEDFSENELEALVEISGQTEIRELRWPIFVWLFIFMGYLFSGTVIPGLHGEIFDGKTILFRILTAVFAASIITIIIAVVAILHWFVFLRHKKVNRLSASKASFSELRNRYLQYNVRYRHEIASIRKEVRILILISVIFFSLITTNPSIVEVEKFMERYNLSYKDYDYTNALLWSSVVTRDRSSKAIDGGNTVIFVFGYPIKPS